MRKEAKAIIILSSVASPSDPTGYPPPPGNQQRSREPPASQFTQLSKSINVFHKPHKQFRLGLAHLQTRIYLYNFIKYLRMRC
jgi:hypothetical protein